MSAGYGDYEDFDEPAESPIEQLMADLEKCRPADQRPFVTYPRTRDDFECAEAERRAEQRRGDLG